MKTEYVCGFCFIPSTREVVLIRKDKPEWQAGRVNGVGGHIEPGETPLQAMEREWLEETAETRTGWELFCTINYVKAVVHFFRTWAVTCAARTNTSEIIVRARISAVFGARFHCRLGGSEETIMLEPIPNLRYLIPMALSGDKGVMHQ